MAMVKTTPDGVYLSDDWHISDVHCAADDMGITITDDEAEDVLYAVANNFDANIGINWEVFYYHLENYRKEDDA
jgi:hypothetical protein